MDTLILVQDRDSVLDQLAWKRLHLPERTELADIDAQLGHQMARADAVGVRRRDLESRQAALEAQAQAAAERIKAIESRMYSGEVSATRDLQAMANEVQSLQGQRSGWDDQAVAILEELEPVEAELDGLAADRRPLEEDRAKAEARLAQAVAVIDDEANEQQGARNALADSIAADLLARYHKLRAHLGGIGAARLVNGSCSGCHLALSAVELSTVVRSPTDAVITCEQCGRILVR
ncbi:MAG: zinc ribbon domain-containing protein [Acidimicrobiales bacterium]